MTTTWILVSHDAGARLFQNDGPGKGLNLRQTLDHPEGRARDGSIDADRPGRSFSRVGPKRSAMSRETTPHEHVVTGFARELAGLLKTGRVNNAYERLVLVAPPRFLGILRDVLDPSTAALVTGSLDKDLAEHDEDELVKHLGAIMAI